MKLFKITQSPESGVSHNPAILKRTIIRNGQVPRITNYARAVFPPGEKAGSHAHDDMSEVFTVESGCGEIRINDVAYVFSTGTTVVVEAGEMHEITNTGDADLIITYFGIVVD